MKKLILIILLSILLSSAFCDSYTVAYIKNGIFKSTELTLNNMEFYKKVEFIDGNVRLVFTSFSEKGLIFITCKDIVSITNEVDNKVYLNCDKFIENEKPLLDENPNFKKDKKITLSDNEINSISKPTPFRAMGGMLITIGAGIQYLNYDEEINSLEDAEEIANSNKAGMLLIAIGGLMIAFGE